jgi:membrane protein DedA with SNARE-associated domain/rhodanese-related sulfurtransferase
MPMNAMTELTYSAIAIGVFAQQACLPVPGMVLLMAAGALAGQHQGHLQTPLVVVSGVMGCLAADGTWFWLGRRWGSGVIRLICSMTSDPRGSRERSRRIFERWGLRLLLFAKFVPVLDGLAPPLAGAQGASMGGFLIYDTAGSLLWTFAYVLLGFLFSSQLDLVSSLIDRFGLILLLFVGVPLVGYTAWRLLRLLRMIRHLRLRRISPSMLQQRLDEGEKVALVDLQRFEFGEGDSKGIPGAFRMDPERLRRDPRRVVVPEGVRVVLYCSSKNEFTSARVAEAMQKAGVSEVWVLEGGLDAWVHEGRGVASELSTPEETAERLGIKILKY